MAYHLESHLPTKLCKKGGSMVISHIFTSMRGEEWEINAEDIDGIRLQELLLCFHEQFK